MDKITLSIVGLLVGVGIGYTAFGAGSDTAMVAGDMHMENGMDMSGEHMAHPMLEVDDTAALPSVSIQALKDTKDGYNIRITASNYRWSPEHVNSAPLQGEGHAHIYVNGVKLARVYGEWFHIGADKLKNGGNEIMVTLNANDHSEWVHNGEHITDTITVTK